MQQNQSLPDKAEAESIMDHKKKCLIFCLTGILLICLAGFIPALADDEEDNTSVQKEQAKKKSQESSSLAKLAKQTRESQKGKPATKAYTNKDLKNSQGNIMTSSGVKAHPKKDVEGTEAGEKESRESVDKKYYQLLVTKCQEIQDLERRRDVSLLNYQKIRTLYANSPNGVYQNRELKPAMNKAYQDNQDFIVKADKAKKELEELKREARRNGVLPKTIREAETEGSKLPEPQYPAPKV